MNTANDVIPGQSSLWTLTDVILGHCSSCTLSVTSDRVSVHRGHCVTMETVSDVIPDHCSLWTLSVTTYRVSVRHGRFQ